MHKLQLKLINHIDYKLLTKSLLIAFSTAVLLMLVTLVLGNTNTFLLLNTNLGAFGDFFFNYITYLGDGVVWVFVIVFTLIFKKKYWVVSSASCFFSTLIAQSIKGYILPAQLRPNSVIFNKNLFHTIPNVYLNDVGSFPSGHTASVFCFYFLAVYFYPKKSVFMVGFILAILTGYSRVYQTQHFPIDVAGGIVTAIVSVYIAILLHHKIYPKTVSKL